MSMLMKVSALKRIMREAIESDRIIPERPWTVELTFRLSGGTASDSEGKAPDGFAVNMVGESGVTMRIVVDTYWNPQQGDQSGNSLKIEGPAGVVSTYVPVRFDDGKEQRLIISNTPVMSMLTVSHAVANEPAIVYLAVDNPFEDDDDVSFTTESLGNGEVDVEVTRHVNL